MTSTHEMQQMAKMAAKEAVAETFLTLGLDVKNPISVQNQFAFLRNAHYSFRFIRNAAIAAAVGAMVSGTGWLLFAGVKVGVAIAGAGK